MEDVCPNIEGVQTSLPSGMVKDTAGNCITPGLGGGDTNGTVLGILTVAPVVTAPKAPAPQPELVNTGQNSIVDMIVGLAIAGIALTTAGLARRRQTT